MQWERRGQFPVITLEPSPPPKEKAIISFGILSVKLLSNQNKTNKVIPLPFYKGALASTKLRKNKTPCPHRKKHFFFPANKFR
jgi:hypothetical protein